LSTRFDSVFHGTRERVPIQCEAALLGAQPECAKGPLRKGEETARRAPVAAVNEQLDILPIDLRGALGYRHAGDHRVIANEENDGDGIGGDGLPPRALEALPRLLV
jgi:hypothetical protein